MLITVGNERTHPDCETLGIFRCSTELSNIQLTYCFIPLEINGVLSPVDFLPMFCEIIFFKVISLISFNTFWGEFYISVLLHSDITVYTSSYSCFQNKFCQNDFLMC